VIDDREEWIEAPDLPKSAIRHACDWSDFVSEAAWDSEKTYVAIMTHRHDMDQDIIADVIRRKARYIGLIGSRAKWIRFQQRLTLKGYEEREFQRVKCPIGVSKAGKSPKEIAVHFASEILQLHHA
jgi:xanthine dehydrogenase accessory factor